MECPTDICPTCGKPIEPFKKVWIAKEGNTSVFYHYVCKPQ